MTTFLFWNLNGKRLEETIVNLAFRQEVDVLILAECDIPPKVMLKALNPKKKAEFHFPFSLCEKVMIFTRFSKRFLKPVFESGRFTIRRLMLPAREEILLVAAHLQSKLYQSEESQKFECTELSRIIRDEEDKVGHQRTLLVGDLNMNPFEDGLVAAAGFHAVMARDIALRRDRVVQSRRYPFFYNPMWSLLGDASSGPCGTYYYERRANNFFLEYVRSGAYTP